MFACQNTWYQQQLSELLNAVSRVVGSKKAPSLAGLHTFKNIRYMDLFSVLDATVKHWDDFLAFKNEIGNAKNVKFDKKWVKALRKSMITMDGFVRYIFVIFV